MLTRWLLATLVVFLFTNPAFAVIRDAWTGWYYLEDTYLNRIDVHFNHTARGDIQYQFRNRYKEMAAIKYRVTSDRGVLLHEGATAIAPGGMSYVSEGIIEGEKNVWITITELRKAGTSTELPKGD